MANSPSQRPQRPEEWSQLGFERLSPVSWFDPGELVRTGAQALVSGLFGSFADRREMQAVRQQATPEQQQQYARESPPGQEFWFDYVADIGDGFNATYSIASLLARPELVIGEHTTRRGRLLLMGGDEVYPVASREQYQNRTVGPYRAALPYIEEPGVPHLYTLPGNHDWYDGLSAFLRQFTQGRWVGAWLSQQHRSYFARKLPGGVWLWGIDIQLHADIDFPQLDYFEAAAKQLEQGDRVILATAEPSWVKEAEGEHAGYQSMLMIMEKVPPGARVALVLTGDSHHYAHYQDVRSEGRVHFVTAGGGGAFLHGTHTLPDELEVPIDRDPARNAGQRTLQRIKSFPSADESRAVMRRRIGLFWWINKAFYWVWFGLWFALSFLVWSLGLEPGAASVVKGLEAALGPQDRAAIALELAVVSVALVLAIALRSAFPLHTSSRTEEKARRRTSVYRAIDIGLWLGAGWLLLRAAAAGSPSALKLVWDGVFGSSSSTLLAAEISPSPLQLVCGALQRSPGAALLVLLITVGSAAYTSRPLEWNELGFQRKAACVGRVALGLYCGSLHFYWWLLAATLVAHGTTFAPLWIIGTSILAAFSSMFLFSCSLWFAGQYERALLNDAFSAIGVEDYKNFLRIRIAPDGKLTVFAIGLEKVVRRWEIHRTKGGDREEPPYIRPAEGEKLTPHLIEQIEIER